MPPTLVLASGSPRRASALHTLGLEFTTEPPDIDETPLPDEQAAAMVHRLARQKVGRADPGTVRLAVDTTVVLDGAILGKPRDALDAVEGLLTLSGRGHCVVSGWAVSSEDGTVSGTVETTVVIRRIEVAEAMAYVATGEPMDKAGSYAIQGFGSRFIARIEGSIGNVMGFPQEAVIPALAEAGVPVVARSEDLVALRRR